MSCSNRTRKCSCCNYVSTEHQVPTENTRAMPSKQRQQQCTQNRGLFLWTVPVHLEVLFPSQQCGQKRPLVSLGPCEDFCAFHPAPSARRLSAWVTVPPIGYRHVLQPHFTLKLSSCQLLNSGWSDELVCPVFFFPSYLSTSLGICKWGMNMEQQRERCRNCQPWINSTKHSLVAVLPDRS